MERIVDMPRIPRKDQMEESLTYHIYNRGNGKLDVFHDEHDFLFFLSKTRKYMEVFHFHIFHWVLMNNHFHFILSIEVKTQLSKCIGSILQSYAQYHHKRWDSAGRLWQGRFASQPVQKERYLYECGRYIERNPMRAGIVQYPWDYRWTSCHAYVRGRRDGVTTIDPSFNSFGDREEERRARYKEWLMEGESDKFNDLNLPVGDEEFTKQLLLKNGRVVARKKGRPSKMG